MPLACYRRQRVDLLTVGEAFEDLIFPGMPRLPRQGEELRVPNVTAAVGGGAVITAIAAARMGLRTGIITALAKSRTASLIREGITVLNLMSDRDHPALSVTLSTARDRTFVTFDGVNRALEPRLLAAMRRFRRRPRHVHFALSPRHCAAWTRVVNLLQSTGATTSWDFGWNERLLRDRGFRELQASVDWLFVNEAEARLYRSVVGRSNTVIKRGARGAIARIGQRKITSSPLRARVVETTGAGDAFNAGFLAAMLGGATPAVALRVANYIGARSTEAVGGISALPERRALPRWIRRYLNHRLRRLHR